MTDAMHSHFVTDHLPALKRIAARRFARIENLHDREDAQGDFIARAWECYVELSRIDAEPALHRVLCALYRPEPVWAHRPEPDFKVLSMGDPPVPRMADAVPA